MKKYPVYADLPNGTVIKYKKEFYFVSDGIESRVVTDTKGHWWFLKDLTWKSYEIVFRP